jgi:Zn finger protein HypA/HybF involved in hydrogenase expression
VHEVSLVEEMVVEVRRQAGGRPVERVRVRHATTIPDEVLRQCWELLTTDDPLADVTLETEPFPILLACTCGFNGPLGHDDVIGPTLAACPGCGELRRTPPTAELELLEVLTAA